MDPEPRLKTSGLDLRNSPKRLCFCSETVPSSCKSLFNVPTQRSTPTQGHVREQSELPNERSHTSKSNTHTWRSYNLITRKQEVKNTSISCQFINCCITSHCQVYQGCRPLYRLSNSVSPSSCTNLNIIFAEAHHLHTTQFIQVIGNCCSTHRPIMITSNTMTT